MARAGLCGLVRADNRRIQGWRAVREYLRGGEGQKLFIFSTCRNLLRTLPQLRFDERSCGDAADTAHEVTHAPESLRYGLMSRPPSAFLKTVRRGVYTKTELLDLKKTQNSIRRRK